MKKISFLVSLLLVVGLLFLAEDEEALAGRAKKYPKGFFDNPKSLICSDTDNGRNYFVQGTVSQGIKSRRDFCQDENHVFEYDCGFLGGVRFQDDCGHSSLGGCRYRCPNGCEEGACVEAECTDSDRGINIYEAGEARDSERGLVDWCSFLDNPHGILKESICNESSLVAYIEITCPEEAPYCNRAICSTVPPRCEDTDGGNEPYVKGTITEPRHQEGPEHNDYCINLRTHQPRESCQGESCGVREFYCTEPYVTTTFEDIYCPNGCRDRACV